MVPCHYLVCYDQSLPAETELPAVVPCHYLVCYDYDDLERKLIKLWFPVITWYVMIDRLRDRDRTSCGSLSLLGML